jgi:integrase
VDQKNKRHSFVPLKAELREIARRWKADREAAGQSTAPAALVLDGIPEDPSPHHRAMLARARVPYHNELGAVGDFHSLRHTSLTHMGDKGVPLHVLQDFARHSDPKITRRYVRENEGQVRAALEHLGVPAIAAPDANDCAQGHATNPATVAGAKV